MMNMNKAFSSQLHSSEFQQQLTHIVKQVMADADIKAFLQQHPDLSQDDVLQSLSQLLEYITQRDRLKKGIPTVAPGYAPRLAVHEKHIVVSYVPTQQLVDQINNEKLLKRITTIDMPADIKHATFNEYQKGAATRFAALHATMQFANNYLKDPHVYHRGLYLYGPFGVGKTYLMGALSRYLAENNCRSTLVHMPTFNVEIKNAINSHGVMKRLNAIKRVPLLILDDIGADTMSPWIRDEVLGVILQYRMQEHLSTFFTSNLTMTELATHLAYSAQGDSEPIKAQRIMERIKFLAQEIMIDGPDRRFNQNS